jgi:hypothetical protein
MSLTSLIDKIKAGVKVVVSHVSAAFVTLFGADAAAQFAASALEVLKTDIGQVVMSAVTAVESLSLTGDQKRAQAFSNVVQTLKTEGKDVADNVINMLIELAVAAMKNDFGVV